MKNILPVMLALMLLFSCGEKKVIEQADSDGYLKPDPMQAVNIFPGIGTFAEVDGKYTGTLDAGEIVEWKDKLQKNEKGWEFAQVKRKNGQEVWVPSAYIVKESRPGIITQENFIFSDPDPAKMLTKEKVPLYAIVAGMKLADNKDFIQVSYTFLNPKDNLTYLKSKVYVKTGIVSFFQTDIQAAILYLKAQNEKDPDAKKEFLKSAYQLDTPSFKQLIKTALDNLENTPVKDTTSSGNSQSWSSTTIDPPETYQVNTDNVDYYSEPDGTSTVVSSLSENERVTVDKRTTEQLMFNDTADYWYHIRDRGWVFGAYIYRVND